MKKLTFILICFVCMLSGCAQIIDSKDVEVQATIKSTYHRDAYTETVDSGAAITHDEENIVYLEYDNETYKLEGRDSYEYCLDRIGETIWCTLTINYYDDDTTKSVMKNVLYDKNS